jgi:hypothetical protein
LTVKRRVRFSLVLRMRKLAWAVVFAIAFSCSAFAGGKGAAKKGGAGKSPPAGAVERERKPPSVNVNRPPEQATAQDAPAGAPPPTRGPTRIDFDDRLIQGQTNKSGAVYLYDRKELKTKSMIKTRDSFRDEIVGSLYDT